MSALNYTLGYSRLHENGETEVSSKWVASAPEALETMANDLRYGFGNITEAWCFEYTPDNDRTLQWHLVLGQKGGNE